MGRFYIFLHFILFGHIFKVLLQPISHKTIFFKIEYKIICIPGIKLPLQGTHLKGKLLKLNFRKFIYEIHFYNYLNCL